LYGLSAVLLFVATFISGFIARKMQSNVVEEIATEEA